jgi:hypothetical protein
MAHTHEYDCVVCGAHFDSQDDLARHDEQNHRPTLNANPSDPAEPIGTERPRRQGDGDPNRGAPQS